MIRARPIPQQPDEPLDIFDAEPEPVMPQQPAPEATKERSFASLFGWKTKPADEVAPAARPVPDEEAFDDDLEIPAFLRRSGNA